MAKGKSAAKKSARSVTVATPDLDVDYSEYPDTAKGRAMARQAARKARDEKIEAKGGSDEPFVVPEPIDENA